METIVIKLYNINELKQVNKNAYDKIIDNTKEYIINDRFDFAYLDIINILKDRYNLIVDKKNIEYSISYCQGDGVCFTLNNILSYYNIIENKNLNEFEKWINENLTEKEKELLFEYLNCGYNLNIIKTSYHYSHAHTCKIDYEYFYSSDDQKYLDDMDNFIYNLCKKLFNEVYISICGELESYLYSFYDIDNGDCVEFLEDNNYLYDKNGIQYE